MKTLKNSAFSARGRVGAVAPTTAGDGILSLGRFLRKGEASADLRSVFLEGGRDANAFAGRTTKRCDRRTA